MTTAFTHVQAHGPSMCDAIGSPSAAFISQMDQAPAASTDNADPHCTPPSSPNKQRRPSTPKSTPLHRRFLEEVSMSPASPATPATPPQTPSRSQRDTPTKERETPAKVRATPKHRGSPATLEIGPNGFYFSCEIPLSKITPKKPASPPKSSQAGTPTRRTPSPLKNVTPVKQTPAKRALAKALFGPSMGKGSDSSKHQVGTLVTKGIEDGSPAWTSSKIHSKEARDPISMPVASLRIPSECLPDVNERDIRDAITEASSITSSHQAQSQIDRTHSANDTRPENIGHMMARLTSGSFKTNEWARAHPGVDPIKSPAPTPLRKASETLYSGTPPSFLKLNAEQRTVTIDEPTKKAGSMSPVQSQGLPVLAGKYFDESKRVKSPAVKCAGTMAVQKMNPAGFKVRTIKASLVKQDDTVGKMEIAEPLSCPALLFSGPNSRSDKVEDASLHRLEKHVQQRNPILSPAKYKFHPSSQHRRAGTDPEVYLAMQKDMASMGESLRRSIGSALSQSTLNTNELPSMSNAILMREMDAKIPKISTPSTARHRLTRWNSDTPAVRTKLPHSLGVAKQRAATLTGPGVPVWHPDCSVAGQVLREKVAAPKDACDGAFPPDAGKADGAVTSRSRPGKMVAEKKLKVPTTAVAATPRRQKTGGTATMTSVRLVNGTPGRKQVTGERTTTSTRPAIGTPVKKQMTVERTTTPARPAIGTPAKKQTPAVPLSKTQNPPYASDTHETSYETSNVLSETYTQDSTTFSNS
ncbi:predicted protein [Plenodomus lingam JN3]|uniref:Predicted protein n=1 Tax=Leptosphaeria maculans (strain JN3 / isolate v23.1.3 / race Av1-4-5-6-7-8) TaxID=985895 RepID=E5ADR6_LEPMJ|nr:predicted protein [Plenodomus lingam JN3]CBY01355.1 predicted protein [Plenodomus lingam JN3]